jgi:hypothetical protein
MIAAMAALVTAIAALLREIRAWRRRRGLNGRPRRQRAPAAAVRHAESGLPQPYPNMARSGWLSPEDHGDPYKTLRASNYTFLESIAERLTKLPR